MPADCYYRGRQVPHIAAMVVKIRLARFGRRNQPFYNIVIAHARFVRPPIHTPIERTTNHHLGRLVTPARSKSLVPTTRSPRPTLTTLLESFTRISSSTVNARGTGSVLVHSLRTQHGGYSPWWAFCQRSSSAPSKTRQRVF